MVSVSGWVGDWVGDQVWVRWVGGRGCVIGCGLGACVPSYIDNQYFDIIFILSRLLARSLYATFD